MGSHDIHANGTRYLQPSAVFLRTTNFRVKHIFRDHIELRANIQQRARIQKPPEFRSRPNIGAGRIQQPPKYIGGAAGPPWRPKKKSHHKSRKRVTCSYIRNLKRYFLDFKPFSLLKQAKKWNFDRKWILTCPTIKMTIDLLYKSRSKNFFEFSIFYFDPFL